MRKIDMTDDCPSEDVAMRERLWNHAFSANHGIIYLEDYGLKMLEAVDRVLALQHQEIVYGEIPGGDDIAFIVVDRDG